MVSAEVNGSTPLRAGRLQSSQGSAEYSISLDRLLWLYLVVPLTIALVVFDQLFLDGGWRVSMRSLPEHYLPLALVFGTPHIVVSNLLLFTNAEYVRHFARHIAWIVPGIILGLAVLTVAFPRWVIVVLVVGWTVHHVLKQQIGVGNMVCRFKGWAFYLWTWVGVCSGTLFYASILLGLSSDRVVQVRWVTAGAAVLVVGLAGFLWRLAGNPLAKRWLVANTAMMAMSSVMFVFGYPLFAVLIPRVVHDATAFAFYLNHDSNRGKSRAVGRFFNPVIRIRFAAPVVVLVVPAFAIGLSAILERAADGVVEPLLGEFGLEVYRPIAFGFVGFLALLHYAFESITWKGSSPYRKYVSVSGF